MDKSKVCLFSFPFCEDFAVNSSDHHFIDTCVILYGKYCKYVDEKTEINDVHIVVMIEPLETKKTYEISVFHSNESIYLNHVEHLTPTEQYQTKEPFRVIEKMSKHREGKAGQAIIPIHAGGVSLGNHSHIFVGHTGQGKSTLISYLTSHGLTYMSDDRIYFSALADETGLGDILVYPYIKPIHLREPGKRILDAVCVKGEYPIPDCTYISFWPIERHVYLPDKFDTTPKTSYSIYFFERGSKNSISEKPIPTLDAVKCLMEAQMWQPKLTKEYLTLLSRMAAGKCWKLEYKDMEWVLDYLRNKERMN